MRTKRIYLFAAAIAMIAGSTMLTSCHEDPYIKNPGDNSNNIEGDSLVDWSDDSTAFHNEVVKLKAQYGARVLSVDEARTLCLNKAYDSNTYYVYGLVNNTTATNTFYLVNSFTSYPNRTFEVYNGKTAYNTWAKDAVKGRWLIISSTLTLYNSQPETNRDVAVVLFSSYVPPVIHTEGTGTKDDPYTITDAILLAKEGKGVEENEWIGGYLVGVKNADTLEYTQPMHSNLTICLAKDKEEKELINTVYIDLWSSLKYREAYKAISPYYNNGQNMGEYVKAKGPISVVSDPEGLVRMGYDDAYDKPVATVDSIYIGEKKWGK